MKKIFIISALIFITYNISFAQDGIKFYHGKYEEALIKAKKGNKLIFIDAYASWCGPCKMMVRNVFHNTEVGDFYNKNFINLKIDMEKGEGPKLKRKFGITAYPTLLFVNKEGGIVKKAIGYHKKESFILLGNEVLK